MDGTRCRTARGTYASEELALVNTLFTAEANPLIPEIAANEIKQINKAYSTIS